MIEHRPRHLAYLIRMWAVEGKPFPERASEAVWRVSVEDVLTRTRHGFANLELAFDFLQRQVATQNVDGDETD